MKSNGVAFPSEPNVVEYDPRPPYPVLVTLTPSITYRLSRPLPPETDGFMCPAVLLLLTPGARYSASASRRPTGTFSRSSLDSTAPAVVDVVSMTGAAPVTLTSSDTP